MVLGYVLKSLQGEKKHEVSDVLRASIETSPDDPEQIRLAEQEMEKYGRVLKVSERIAIAKHKEARVSAMPSINNVPAEMVDIVMIERAGVSKKFDLNTTPQVANASVGTAAKMLPAIAFFCGVFSFFDLRAKRVPNVQVALRYSAALGLPMIGTLLAGTYTSTLALNQLKPIDRGNCRRAMKYHFFTTLACAAPFFGYHAVRHVLLRPKNITRIAYWNKVHVPLNPFKPGQRFGMYKPIEAMTAYEWGFTTILTGVLPPVCIMMYAVMGYGGDGDALLLCRQNPMLSNVVPKRLEEHLLMVQRRGVEESKQNAKATAVTYDAPGASSA